MLFHETDLPRGWPLPFPHCPRGQSCASLPRLAPDPGACLRRALTVLGMDAPDTTPQVWLAEEGQVMMSYVVL